MAKRSCAFLVSAWLSVGCGAQLRRIRDASLENLRAGPRTASKGLQLPGNAEKSVTLSRLPHDTGPHHHERTVRPRPRIGGNGAECTGRARGVDKFVVCQEGRLPSSPAIPDGLQRSCMTRSGNQTSAHRRCCMFLCCLDIRNGARCARSDPLDSRSAYSSCTCLE